MFLLNVKRSAFWGAILPGLLSGALWLLAFPPFEGWGWWLTFVAPLPLVIVAGLTRAPLRSGLGAMAGGLLFWGWQQWWAIDVSAAGFAPLVLYLAIYSGLFVWILGRVARRLGWAPLWLAAPIVWVGLEVLRGEVVWHGYPWYLLAHPTIHWPGLAHLASVGGVYLVSLIVVAPACVLGELLVGRLRRAERAEAGDTVWAGLILCVAVLAWCASPWSFDRLSDPEPVIGDENAPPAAVRFGVVQTSVPQDNKIGWTPEQRLADFKRFIDLTRRAASVAPDVIVWPETMFPGYSLSPDAVAEERDAGLGFPNLNLPSTIFYDSLLAFEREIGIPMIVGAIGVDGFEVVLDDQGRVRALESEAEFNSAFVVRDGAVDETRYDKIHLTPFGEVMPYISAWPALETALLDLGAGGMAFNLDAGRTPVRLEVPLTREGLPEVLTVATPICFEISNSGVVRRLVFDGRERRAGVIVQLTNDGWFGDDPGGRSAHLMLARWRAIELATPVVRAANTGISAAIDADGRMIRQWAIPETPGATVGLGANPAGILTASVVPAGDGDVTLFVTIGNAVGWVALGLTGLLALATFLSERTNDQDARTQAGAGA